MQTDLNFECEAVYGFRNTGEVPCTVDPTGTFIQIDSPRAFPTREYLVVLAVKGIVNPEYTQLRTVKVVAYDLNTITGEYTLNA